MLTSKQKLAISEQTDIDPRWLGKLYRSAPDPTCGAPHGGSIFFWEIGGELFTFAPADKLSHTTTFSKIVGLGAPIKDSDAWRELVTGLMADAQVI